MAAGYRAGPERGLGEQHVPRPDERREVVGPPAVAAVHEARPAGAGATRIA